MHPSPACTIPFARPHFGRTIRANRQAQNATALTEMIWVLHVQEVEEAPNDVPQQLDVGHAQQVNGWPAPGGGRVGVASGGGYPTPSYEGGAVYNGEMQVGQPHQSHGAYNGGVPLPMHKQYATGVYQDPAGRRQETVDERHLLSLVNGAMTGSMQRYKEGGRDAMQPAYVQAPLVHKQAGAPQQRHSDQGWDHGRPYGDSVWPPHSGQQNADMRPGAPDMKRRAREQRWVGPAAQQGGRGHRRW